MIAGTARSIGITVTGNAPFNLKKKLDNGKIDKKSKKRLQQKLRRTNFIL